MKKYQWLLVMLLVFAMVFSACQTTEEPTTAEEPTAEEAVVAEEEAVVEEEEEAVVEEEEAMEGEGEAEVDVEAVVASLPRNETLYYAGLQWGPMVGTNPYSSNNNLAFMGGQRNLMHETPYMYNMIDGSLTPLLADGDFAWNDDLTEITFMINPAAHWQDGTPVTAEDVAYTWATHVKYETATGVGNQEYIADIVAVDEKTVVVKAALNDEGAAVNPLVVAAYLSQNPVIQKAWTQTLEERVGEDAAALKADTGEGVVLSGPYKMFYNDNTKVVLIRDDNYWGQDESMWGMLPVPKYIAHTIYSDNNAGFVALKAGEVDISQQFNANVQLLWLEDNLPISTYMEEAPYGLTASLPTAYFNLKSFGLDRVEVRKAIAMAVDYDTIIANAMTNQSPTFAAVPRSVMNPTDGEQALYDQAAVADLQWVGSEIDAANALLDEAGIVDTDGDGYREIDGQKLSYNAVCPNGWSDWQAAIEIVAAAGEKIGIEITTYFPEWSVYQTVFTEGSQEEYDIFMVWSDGAGPTQPWGRVRQLMNPGFAGASGNWNGNWGGYVNPRIGEIIAEIPQTTDQAKLVELYTEATEIYLTDVPSFSLMYRPDQFYTVNETVWTGFPASDDGLNIPPLNLADGYGIAALYYLELVNP